MAPRSEPFADPHASERPDLSAALELARGWAGDDALALILGGSHATHEGVWVPHGGGMITVSDLDLYAVLPDPGAVAAAERRWRQDQPLSAERLASLGLAAPIEIAFTTPVGLARMTARPSTLELARTSRVVAGDPAWRERIPHWSPRDVPHEEVLLLLENRAFELLYAHALRTSPNPLDRARRRHATLKAALDVAGALCLLSGAWPEYPAARVAWARGLDAIRFERVPPWNEALAWRRGDAPSVSDAEERAEWLATATAWTQVWRRAMQDEERSVEVIRRAANRAPLRRRLRQAIAFRPHRAAAPPLTVRLAHAWQGTPQHRLNAAAAATTHVLCGRFTESEWRDAIRTLGILDRHCPPDAAAGQLVRLWDLWMLDGQRTAGWM